MSTKALTVYVGHASISTTMDVNGHLMRGSEDEAVGLVDAYLDRRIPDLRSPEVVTRRDV